VKRRRPHFVRRPIETTSRQQQTERTLLDWPRSKKLKPEGGKRRAKVRGIKTQEREEQEDGEGKKLPLTAAPSPSKP
jgi:hypothetical protein